MSNDLHLTHWRKSSYSDTQGACIEVADGQFTDLTPVRGSKDPAGPARSFPALAFPARSFAAFVASVKSGVLSAS